MFIIAITAKEKVFGYLSNMTEDELKHLDNSQIYAAYPLIKKDNIRKIKKEFLKARTVTNQKSHDKQATAPTTGGSHTGFNSPTGRDTDSAQNPPLNNTHTHDSSAGDEASDDRQQANGSGGEGAPIQLSPKLQKAIQIAKLLPGKINLTQLFTQLVLEELDDGDTALSEDQYKYYNQVLKNVYS